MSRNVITIERQEGQTMAEYAAVLGVITFLIVTTISVVLSGAILDALQRTVDIINTVV